MKKIISLFAICIVINFIACSQNNSDPNYSDKTDWEKDGLKGKVKKVIEGDAVIEYNQQGFRINATHQFLWIGQGYALYGDFFYKYDSIGRIIHSICYRTTENNSIVNELSKEELVERLNQDWKIGKRYDGTLFLFEYTDTIIHNYYYNKKGDSLFYIIDLNNKIDTIGLYKNQWYLTRYEDTHYPSMDSLIFDYKGRVSTIVSVPHWAYMNIYYYYNDKDQIIKECYVDIRDNKTKGIGIREYNKDGIIEKNVLDGWGEVEVTFYKYKLDEVGNWIERIEYNDSGSGDSITTNRKIEYYK